MNNLTLEELSEVIKNYVQQEIAVVQLPAIDVDAISKQVAVLVPVPKDGVDGKDGESGKDGIDGKDGQSVSEDSISASFERRFSDLQLSWERQARETFEKAVDKMPIPKDGKDGADALPLEEIEIIQDGRNVTLKLGKVERTIKLDTILYRGVWKEGDFEKGDAVTYGGSLWIAQKDAPTTSPSQNDEWKLAVKKGRDGKDLRDNASTRKEGEAVIL